MIPKRNKESRNIDIWENILKDLPNSYQKWFAEENTFLHKHIRKNARVLEIGCGYGRSLHDILDITAFLTGIDHDSTAIEHTKLRFKSIPSIKIIQAKAEQTPFPDASFDYVICMTTFANFGQKKYDVLAEMKRVLKKKGSILISVFSEDALAERLKVYKKMHIPLRKITKEGTVIFDEDFDDNTSEQFSKSQLLQIFRKAKLKVVEIKKVNIAYLRKLTKE